MKVILDFVTNSSEADYYYDCDCDCNYDCDCDCDCNYDCDCDCDCEGSFADYINEMFDGDYDLYESNMSDD